MRDQESLPGAEQDLLLSLKEQLLDFFPDGPLVGMSATFDQGKAVSKFLDAILDNKVQSTTALTAARGRGKSAALGLGIAGAIAAGYSNIFVTAPTTENLKSLFEFVCRGLQALEYEVCLEGQISQVSALHCQPVGDLLKLKISEAFMDTVFHSLSGVRIVRIAVHPHALGYGYGSAALDQLTRSSIWFPTLLGAILRRSLQLPYHTSKLLFYCAWACSSWILHDVLREG